MSKLPTQEQIWTDAAEAAARAAQALSEVRDILNSDWSDRKALTDQAADARTSAYQRLVDLKTGCYEMENALREGARSLRNRR